MNRQSQLAAIFADTQEMIESIPKLREASRRSAAAARFYDADRWPSLGEPTRAGVVRVTRRRSFEAARAIAAEHPGARVAVHNFASSTNPGGGVKNGSSAQEESLCRCSTLYDALDQRRMWDAFYLPNRGSGDNLGTDACIWVPDVTVCKSDEALPQRLEPSDWLVVDVVTCAAPNLRGTTSNLSNPAASRTDGVPLTRIYDIHRRRARHLLAVAADAGADALVLGAFGCGAFRNDPYLVSSAWHEAVAELRHHFDLIEFAVFHMPYEKENYVAFRDEFAAESETDA